MLNISAFDLEELVVALQSQDAYDADRFLADHHDIDLSEPPRTCHCPNQHRRAASGSPPIGDGHDDDPGRWPRQFVSQPVPEDNKTPAPATRPAYRCRPTQGPPPNSCPSTVHIDGHINTHSSPRVRRHNKIQTGINPPKVFARTKFAGPD